MSVKGSRTILRTWSRLLLDGEDMENITGLAGGLTLDTMFDNLRRKSLI